MVMPSNLLPPSSTALERALVNSITHAELDALADAPSWTLDNPPDALLPWLVSDYRLADFTPCFSDLRALWTAGRQWLNVRGTPLSVQMALGWIALQATTEHTTPAIQIDTGSADAAQQVADIKKLCAASLPLHTELYRLYHGYDHRVLRGSSGDTWGNQFLSDDSGVYIDGIKCSFGRTHRGSADAAGVDGADVSGHTRIHASVLVYPDVLRWGVFRCGDGVTFNTVVVHTRNRLHAGGSDGIGERADHYGWEGPWDSRSWRGDISTVHTQVTG
jgi:hypothetical protein